MHRDDYLADNLIARLFSYSPRKDRDPLEDYCTECLAWSLRNSDRFRAAFLKRVGVSVGHSDWSVDTQVTFKPTTFKPTEDSDEGEEETGSRFDLVLKSNDCVVVIESKVHGSKPSSEQLGKYWGAMKTRWPSIGDSSRVLVSLWKRGEELTDKNILQITWTEVQKQLGVAQSGQGTAAQVAFVLECFSEFITEQAMTDKPLTIGSQDIATYVQVVGLWEELRNLVSQVASQTVGAKKKPVFDPPELGKKHVWIGLYPNEGSRGQLKDLWFGFGISEEDVPAKVFARIDFAVPLARSAEVVRQLGGLKPLRADDSEGNAYFRFVRDLRHGESSLDVEAWFVERIKSLLRLS